MAKGLHQLGLFTQQVNVFFRLIRVYPCPSVVFFLPQFQLRNLAETMQ